MQHFVFIPRNENQIHSVFDSHSKELRCIFQLDTIPIHNNGLNLLINVGCYNVYIFDYFLFIYLNIYKLTILVNIVDSL